MRNIFSFLFRTSGACCLVVAAGLFGIAPTALGSTEAVYKKSVAKYKPVDIVSKTQLEQAQRTYAERNLQISGSITGVMSSGESKYIILRLVDESDLDIKVTGEYQEVQAGARVRVVVKPTQRNRYELLDIMWDQTPVDVLVRAAQAALKIPPKNKEEITLSAEQVRRAQQVKRPLVTRGSASVEVIRRAIAKFNPRLNSKQIDTFASAIVRNCNEYGLENFDDQMLVVAMIAAESRFNPKARSHAGAAGLGQLMPATAAAHGVDPYDPIQNIEIAVRIIRSNLDKYKARDNEQWLLALAAYNAGSGAVKKHGGVPPYRETQNYLWRIYGYWCDLTGRTPVARPK